MITIAHDFGEFVEKHKKELDIVDTMLYGSTVRKIQGSLNREPNDLDFLLIHEDNNAFDDFSFHFHQIYQPHFTKFLALCELLREHGFPTPIIQSGSSIEKALREGKLEVNFLGLQFFKDEDYAQKMRAVNEDPDFYENIFDYGLLYNPKTRTFNIPGKDRYPAKGIVLPSSAQTQVQQIYLSD